jgi:CrcB protein
MMGSIMPAVSFPWREIACVAGGGAVGSLARYGVGVWLGQAHQAFPMATLVVNMVGCFLIGVVGGILPPLPEWARLMLVTGFLGGLTTFSSFGYETLREFEARGAAFGLANIGANVLLGLGAVWVGLMTTRLFSS